MTMHVSSRVSRKLLTIIDSGISWRDIEDLVVVPSIGESYRGMGPWLLASPYTLLTERQMEDLEAAADGMIIMLAEMSPEVNLEDD